jgi:membrane protein implicated in regulation of membrane protease activity
MQVAVALAVALLAFGVLVLLAGLTPFIGIPLAVAIFLIPIAFIVATGRRGAERAGGGEGTVEKSGVPSTREATYEPTVDPAERGP